MCAVDEAESVFFGGAKGLAGNAVNLTNGICTKRARQKDTVRNAVERERKRESEKDRVRKRERERE